MNRARLLATLATTGGIGALASGASPAKATPSFDLLAESTYPAATVHNSSQTVSLGQFDPSLGTLNAVDITLSNSATGGSAAVDLIGAAGDSVTVRSTGLLAVQGPSSVLFDEITSQATLVCLISSNGSCNATGSQDDPTFSPDPVRITSNLSPFEGTGAFDLTAELDAHVPVVVFTAGSTPIASAAFQWSGDLSVSYEYTPAPVPEPASMTLLGLGIVGLRMARRRRT